MSQEEIYEKIKELESKKEYHEHATPVKWDKMLKVDGDYRYLRTTPLERVAHLSLRGLIGVAKYPITKFRYSLKVVGRENLKGITNAVAIINHVDEFDSMIAVRALKHKKVYITIGEFNNFKNLLGSMLRAWGTMPLSDSLTAQKNMFKATETILKKKNRIILFYPEGSMWQDYKKPRPHLKGAYHYAVRFDLPIVPLFITFPPKRNKDKFRRRAVVHILSPIYPNSALPRAKNIEYMTKAGFKAFKDCYEQVYNQKCDITQE